MNYGKYGSHLVNQMGTLVKHFVNGHNTPHLVASAIPQKTSWDSTGI